MAGLGARGSARCLNFRVLLLSVLASGMIPVLNLMAVRVLSFRANRAEDRLRCRRRRDCVVVARAWVKHPVTFISLDYSLTVEAVPV